MHIVTSTAELATTCAELARQPFVAIDTEFLRDSTYWPKLCLIQVAGDGVEAVIDPLAAGIDLTPLFELCADKNVLKVFHAARQDIEIFFNLTGQVPAPLFDSQPAAAALGLGDTIAYDSLVRTRLNRSVDKSSRFTDWSRRPLSDKQLTYALSDVTHLRDLFPGLRRDLDASGRAHWLDEEMAILADPSTYDTQPEDAWRRLKMRKTTPEYLAALKAVAAWREAEARSRDIPRSRVMKDDAVYEIALQRPTSVDALGRLRGVPKGFERSRYAAGLLDALSVALKDPKAYAPKFERPPPSPPNIGPVVDFLKVLLRLKAEEHGVAARLISTVPDLERIAADDQADVPALKGWRRDVFGSDALALKRGELALKLDGARVVAVDTDKA